MTFYPFTSSLRTCETEQTPPVRNGVGPRFPRSLRQAVSSAVARTTRAPGAHRCAGARSRHLTSVSVCSLCSLSQVFSCPQFAGPFFRIWFWFRRVSVHVVFSVVALDSARHRHGPSQRAAWPCSSLRTVQTLPPLYCPRPSSVLDLCVCDGCVCRGPPQTRP